ncbi:4-dihydrotrisporin dehydrogenase [Mucor mucedo]|uniref:4-dihydrotrisporin dehydrogenase n=1 Tax=Mucor mucedo TaxID=29922 RepID=UPI0022201A94|nr:4-dihydrotrisporin dehydrogenase [Mucor mucedo]KAI7895448.1 4-dihydrotrisporin dehydrogenase [Mucor mucedo]
MTLTYVITGASRGLGLEFVKQVSLQGHLVFALARHPESSEPLQALLKDRENVIAVKMDTTCENSIKEAVEKVSQRCAGAIDILINNAGINGPKTFNVENTPKKEYVRIFETNVGGVSDVTQAFLPLLRQGTTKKILNISSILGSITNIATANPGGHGSAYDVSKTALNMLTKLFANHLAKENFIVYSTHPGWVKTDMGGESAPVEQADSIAGMLKVLDTIQPQDNGSFYNYTGSKLEW